MKHDTCLRQQFFLQAVRVVNSSACHNKPSHTDLPPVQHQKHSPSHKSSKNLCFLSQRPTTGLHLLRHNKKPLAPSLKSQLIVSATFAFSLKFLTKNLKKNNSLFHHCTLDGMKEIIIPFFSSLNFLSFWDQQIRNHFRPGKLHPSPFIKSIKIIPLQICPSLVDK